MHYKRDNYINSISSLALTLSSSFPSLLCKRGTYEIWHKMPLKMNIQPEKISPPLFVLFRCNRMAIVVKLQCVLYHTCIRYTGSSAHFTTHEAYLIFPRLQFHDLWKLRVALLSLHIWRHCASLSREIRLLSNQKSWDPILENKQYFQSILITLE